MDPTDCAVAMNASGSHGGSDTYARLDAAFRAGDLDALRVELGEMTGFPNVIAHPAIGACLPYAIYCSPLSLIIALLDLGADPNWPDDDGFPPIIAALTCSTPVAGATTRDDVPEIVAELLSHGANPNQRGLNDYTPLHWAAQQGDLRVIDLLLDNGADPNEITRIDDMETPLEVAAGAGRAAAVERLQPLTVRLDWEQASRDGDVGILQRLVRAGHDINATDGYGQTALMRAAHAGRLDAVSWLVAHGADLDRTAKYRLSALMLAVIAGRSRVARVLVDAGADATLTGSGAPGFHGKTASDLALERGDNRLAAFIQRRNSGG